MKTPKIVILTLAAALLTGGLAEAGWWSWFQRAARPDVAETLKRRGNFKTLLALVDKAGLTGALTGDDAVTVLAPNDAAFAKLPTATVDFLLSDAGADTLESILKHHVLAGKQGALRLLSNTTVESLIEKPILVKLENRRVQIDDATLLRANIRANNGLIHEIDTVLSIPEQPDDVDTVVDLLVLDGRFSTLIDLVGKAGLASALTGDGPVTVFAPTNAAFEKLDADTVAFLLTAEGKETLIAILKYHVAAGDLDALRLLKKRRVETLLDDANVKIRFRRGGVRVNDSKVVAANLRAPNGIVHVIDSVLTPPE